MVKEKWKVKQRLAKRTLQNIYDGLCVFLAGLVYFDCFVLLLSVLLPLLCVGGGSLITTTDRQASLRWDGFRPLDSPTASTPSTCLALVLHQRGAWQLSSCGQEAPMETWAQREAWWTVRGGLDIGQDANERFIRLFIIFPRAPVCVYPGKHIGSGWWTLCFSCRIGLFGLPCSIAFCTFAAALCWSRFFDHDFYCYCVMYFLSDAMTKNAPWNETEKLIAFVRAWIWFAFVYFDLFC